ncbi:MAG: type I restriction endonuclease subunit R [bacterium]|nr:type I restriction endonuclease subunit R [bacterium]
MKDLKNLVEAQKYTVAEEREFNFPPILDYQSEVALENALIAQLIGQGYQRANFKSESELIENLRQQIEQLNDYRFSDSDWRRFFEKEIANKSQGIVEKTTTIQEDHKKAFIDETGKYLNIYLIDKNNIHRNKVQVMNQYSAEGASVVGESRKHRYDVTILINGLPLVHIELKRRGVNIKEAFNQIERYQRESFWSESGLFEFIQIFVISNGTTTKYYSNTTRVGHLRENDSKIGKKRTSNSFEFTSFWAYSSNKRIEELREFTATFLSKHTLLNILTKYCIFTTDRMLMVMRPYQIAATEKILERINMSLGQKLQGTVRGGGYIWHTTGSGKTLTSFKTAKLASKIPEIDKVMFVVDRQDLDYQTMKEYDKFEKDSVDGSKNTRELERNIRDSSKRILVTTIQKLSKFITRNDKSEIYNQNVVLIFDECHRSQFGEMHTAITKKFKKYLMFGFTGTPIFAANANASSKNPNLKTTEQAFGDKLHTYTVLDAIRDQNVLKFKVDFVNTVHQKDQIQDEKIPAIDAERALNHPERISKIVEYILQNFDAKTLRNDSGSYTLKEKRVRGFNSMFAVSSIPVLKEYYKEFQRQMSGLPSDKRLKIATIFSFGQNDAVEGDVLPDENFETDGLNLSDRDFLATAIQDYNQMFGTNYDTSSEKFQNYYRDLSQRIKNRELDLVIVVNMFLTGFDATTLNTLWVDKNLRMHGLIQAFSRTNRILNAVKAFGNIVCFRNLEEETNEAISLFGDGEQRGTVLLRPFDDYYFGYKEDDKENLGYTQIVEQIEHNFPLPINSQNYGEEEKREFVKLFGAFLRLKNILRTFDDFEGRQILSDGQIQDYQSFYLTIRDEFVNQRPEKSDIANDLVFEMDLVRSIEINIDYILILIEELHSKNIENKEILARIDSAILSSPNLRSKKDLIDNFVNQINASDKTDQLAGKWREFVLKNREKELTKIIEEEKLQDEKARKFVKRAFSNGEIKETGTEIIDILPPTPLFALENQESTSDKKERVLERLRAFFERFFGI